MDEMIMIGATRFNPRQHQLERDGKILGLTPMEARVLIALASRPNTVYPESELFEAVYGSRDFNGVRALIRSKIRHLRHKIEPDPTSPIYIQSVPDVGYRLNI